MAQSSMGVLPGVISETVFVEIRALVFLFDPRVEQWSPVGPGGEKSIYSRVQLLCMRRPESSIYRVVARLESNGAMTLDIQLRPTIIYQVLEPTWHQIRMETKAVFGLKMSPDSDGGKFAIVVQNILRSLQGGQPVAIPQQRPLAQVPSAWPEHPASQQSVPLQSRPPEPSRESARTLSRRDYDANIDKQCLLLSQAVVSGEKKRAEELISELATRKLNLSIKLKNPVFVTVEPQPEEGVDGQQTTNTIVVKVLVEDQETSGGSFNMKVAPTITTVAKLKEEVRDRFGFPEKMQQWIIGRRLPRDDQTLQDIGVVQTGTTLFLYLVSGKTVGLRRSEFENVQERTSNAATNNQDTLVSSRNSTATTSTATTSQGDLPVAASTVVSNVPQPTVPNSNTQPDRPAHAHIQANVPLERGPTEPTSVGISTQSQGNVPQPLRIQDLQRLIMNQVDILQGQTGATDQSASMPVMVSAMGRESSGNVMAPTHTQGGETQRHSLPAEASSTAGWQCPACTLINTPTRPGCEVCSTTRPEEYTVPAQFVLDEREKSRIEEEQKQAELFRQQEEQQRRQEEEQRTMNFLTLLQTAQQALIPNTDAFDCAICFSEVEPGEGVMLRECLHPFCKDCLREHIRNSTDPEVQCPFQDELFACHATIIGQEIQALLSPDDFNKFLNRSLATAESQAGNSFHCKTPNCQGWCIYEDNLNTFACPVCSCMNCLTCKAIHPDMNCREYQDDLKRRSQNDDAAKQTQQYLEQMVAKGDAMKCPQCEIILLKKDGCDWMRCSMCRTEICWATRGRRWGPGGVGDVSAGCKCRVGGKKCHPKCRNCH